MNKATGTILLPTLSAVALFDHELQGQFSDGMWENSGPRDHWKFWCNLEVKKGPEPKVLTDRPWECRKVGYNIASLYEIVGDRMVRLGQMGRAAEKIGMEALSYDQAHAAEYLPATLEEFHKLRDGVTKHQYDFAQKYIEAVTPELAEAFYATAYTMKDLRSDVKAIKAAMKTVRN